jgi:hypothetical protein
MSNNCSSIFQDLYDYFENYKDLENINLTYNNIVRCRNENNDNIVMYIAKNVSKNDVSKINNKIIPLFNKIISVIKSNSDNRVLKELFNETDSYKNNWLQILIQSLDYRYNNEFNSVAIKQIIDILSDKIFSKYIQYTNINNVNNYKDIALLMAANNPYLNEITLKYLANKENINKINDSGDSVILICSYNHINLNLLDKLLNEFSNINVNIINQYENNVLFNIINYENEAEDESNKDLIISIVNKLIDKGINLKFNTSNGSNALIYSVLYNKIDIFKIIFDRLIVSDKKYVIDSLQSFINTNASPNIVRYYDEHISLKDKYSSNNIPLLVPSSNKIPSTDITIKYGVELEICVKLDKKCIKRDINTGSIIYSHRESEPEPEPNEDLNEIDFSDPKEWLDLTAIFLDNYIKQRTKTNNHFKRLVNKLRDLYKFIVITNTPKNKNYKYIYDLNKLHVIRKDGVIDYTNPIITTDISVICGDYKYLYNSDLPNINSLKKKYNIREKDLENTFHIEFVTPILSCNPTIGKNGISYDLSPLNELFILIGMDKQGCFITNNSQGFHVNLSLVNNKTGKPLPLLREFFKTQFLKNYVEWEKNAYPKYRKNVSEYAKPLYSFIKPNNMESGYSQLASNKYVSLHRKDLQELVEVRLFASTNDYKNLISRTKEALSVLYTSYNKWYSSIKTTMYENVNINKNKKLKIKGTVKKNRNYINLSSKPNNIRNTKRNKTRNKRKILN